MNAARGSDMPYAVFTVMRILNDGVVTILSFEMPPPMIVTSKYANVLPQRTITIENALIGESHCHLMPGEGVLIVTDGITQAGLGSGYVSGWTSEGVGEYITDCMSGNIKLRDIPRNLINKAREIWGKSLGDDCTAVIAACRWGKVVNIFTGPPNNPKMDRIVASKFMKSEGIKVVCGGTTSKIIADYLGKEVTMEDNPQSLLSHLKYNIEGVDLVTEGAITLNQVYNTLDDNNESFDEESAVSELHSLLVAADRINIFMGTAVNPATKSISFRQKGILSRQSITQLIAQKLKDAGKLVVIENV